MGHRLYQFAASKTFHLDRKEIAKLLDEIRDHFYQANHTWITSVRRHMRRNLIDGLIQESARSRTSSFLSFPVPECSCLQNNPAEGSCHASSPSARSQLHDALGTMHHCPSWMDGDAPSRSMDKEDDEYLEKDDSDSTATGLLFRQSGGGESPKGGVEVSSKEDAQIEDQEELEGGER